MNPRSTAEGERLRQISWRTGAGCLLMLLPTAIAAWIDTRTLNDVNVWSKPLKFQASFALHWLSVAWLLGRVELPQHRRFGTRALLLAGAAATLAEVLYIALQAARGRSSHFNFETAWEAAMYYGFMGPAAVLIVVVTGWLGLRVWNAPQPPSRGGLQRGAALGLMLSSVLTLLVSAPLAAGAIDGPGHWVGGLRSDAAGLPLLGWSTLGGDLRVPHFFATHLLQALLLLGACADWLALRHAARWLDAAAVLGVAWVGATFWQAANGVPFVGAAYGSSSSTPAS